MANMSPTKNPIPEQAFVWEIPPLVIIIRFSIFSVNPILLIPVYFTFPRCSNYITYIHCSISHARSFSFSSSAAA